MTYTGLVIGGPADGRQITNSTQTLNVAYYGNDLGVESQSYLGIANRPGHCRYNYLHQPMDEAGMLLEIDSSGLWVPEDKSIGWAINKLIAAYERDAKTKVRF